MFPNYSVMLTSCGRFDLLKATVESLLRHLDIPPAEFIVIEDSGDESVSDALAGMDYPFQFIINKPQLGQAASIDRAYSRVKTPYIFHCEDDWEFFTGGFVAPSFRLLSVFPEFSAVLLRGKEESGRLSNLPIEYLDNISFFRAKKESHPYYFGISYNPGLRRLEDWLRIGRYARLGGERNVSWAYKQLGFVTAHLQNAATRHIGDGRHAADPTHPQYSQEGNLKTSLTERAKRARWRMEQLFQTKQR